MSSKNYYVNGNTVRELDTPVRHNQRTRKEIEEARRRKNRRNAARRNRKRAMEMSRGYVVFLTACVVITALTAVLFVQMQSQMTTRMKNVANLEKKVPRSWITEEGDYVTAEMKNYIEPLIQAELTPIMITGQPRHIIIDDLPDIK